jgi:hypothetical protein
MILDDGKRKRLKGYIKKLGKELNQLSLLGPTNDARLGELLSKALKTLESGGTRN